MGQFPCIRKLRPGLQPQRGLVLPNAVVWTLDRSEHEDRRSLAASGL